MIKIKKFKNWGREEWGNVLMILGLLFLVGTFVGIAPFAMVGLETPIASVKAEGISERSAVGSFIGLGLIIVGAVLRFKK